MADKVDVCLQVLNLGKYVGVRRGNRWVVGWMRDEGDAIKMDLRVVLEPLLSCYIF